MGAAVADKLDDDDNDVEEIDDVGELVVEDVEVAAAVETELDIDATSCVDDNVILDVEVGAAARIKRVRACKPTL